MSWTYLLFNLPIKDARGSLVCEAACNIDPLLGVIGDTQSDRLARWVNRSPRAPSPRLSQGAT